MGPFCIIGTMVNSEHIPQVTVVADAEVSVLATIGTLTVAVTASATAAAEAYSLRKEAVATVSHVLAAADALEVRNEQVTETNDADDHFGHRTDEPKVRALWECEVICDLRTGGQPHEQLREVVSRLAAVPLVKVTGPHWSLDPQSAQSVRTQAQTDALLSAAEQANTMVKPFGQETGEILDATINISGHRVFNEPEAQQFSLARAAAEPLPERTLDLELAPSRETVAANVKATFRLNDVQTTSKTPHRHR